MSPALATTWCINAACPLADRCAVGAPQRPIVRTGVVYHARGEAPDASRVSMNLLRYMWREPDRAGHCPSYAPMAAG